MLSYLCLPARPAALKLPVPQPRCVMHMTVDAGSITALRHLAMRVCGETMEFMRIAARARGDRAEVWLCVSQPSVALVTDAIMASLPGVKFGQFSRLVPTQISRARLH